MLLPRRRTISTTTLSFSAQFQHRPWRRAAWPGPRRAFENGNEAAARFDLGLLLAITVTRRRFNTLQRSLGRASMTGESCPVHGPARSRQVSSQQRGSAIRCGTVGCGISARRQTSECLLDASRERSPRLRALPSSSETYVSL